MDEEHIEQGEDSDSRSSGDSSSESSDEDHRDPCTIDECDELVKFLPRHLRCGSHTTNLLASTDVVKIISATKSLNTRHKSVMARCNVLWKLMGSPKKKEQVIKIIGYSLLRPMVVRWNTTYEAINQLYQKKEEILELIAAMKIQSSLRDSDFRYIFYPSYLIIPSFLSAISLG